MKKFLYRVLRFDVETLIIATMKGFHLGAWSCGLM